MNIKSLKGDILGGLVATLLSLPMNIPLGLLALAPLGPGFLATGVASSLTASIVTGSIAAMAGGSRLQISGPRGSVSLIMAGAISVALNHQANSQQAFTIGFLVVFLAGLTQILMGFARVGKAIKYIPYPVLAGFMNGVAILVILGQLAAALGLPSTMKWDQISAHFHEIQWPAVGVTLATMVTMKLSSFLNKKMPPIILAFIVGVSVDQALRSLIDNASLGPLVGSLDVGIPNPYGFWLMVGLPWSNETMHFLIAELPTILVMALVASIESLLSASAIDAESGDNHDSNRELVGQGLGNAVGACFGCLACTGAPNRGLSSYRVGGNSRRAAIIHSMILLSLLVWGNPIIASLPYSVMAGTMIIVSIGLMDFSLFILAYNYGQKYFADCAIVIIVALVAVVANLAIAVMCGFIAASAIFITHMSKPVIRRIFDRTSAKSLRRRPLKAERYLLKNGNDIIIIEIEGPLFFGTTENFRLGLVYVISRRPKVVILDLTNISYLDLSGARAISQLFSKQSKENYKLIIAGLQPQDPNIALLMMLEKNRGFPEIPILGSLDRALEHAENIILTDVFEKIENEFPLMQMDIFSDLDENEMNGLFTLLEQKEYSANETIFNLGDKGDGLYVLVSGSVEVHYPIGSGTRFATFGPGTIFGEMALLDGKPRSASAVSLESSTVYRLSSDKIKSYQNTHPYATTKILTNIGREMSERLRLADFRLLGRSFHEFITENPD